MKRLMIPALLLMLPACAKTGNYPSLNPRPIESKAAMLLGEPETPSAALQPASEAATAKIEAALSAARAADAAFNSSLGGTQSAARSAGALGTESWIAAQMAVSALEGTRTPVKASLTDLDGLLRTTLAGPPSEDLANVEAAIRTVEAIDGRHHATMEVLLRALSR